MLRYRILSILITIIISVYSVNCSFPESNWTDLESDYDHILNVLGVINIDESQNSFIGIYRTTNLNEISSILISIDTIGYYQYDENEKEGKEDGYWEVDSIYAPAAIINNAEVIIMDESENSYPFVFIEKRTVIDTIYFDTTIVVYGQNIFYDTTYYDTTDIYINLYMDTTGSFNAQPNMNYNLLINAPGYDLVTGSLVTPSKSEFNNELMRDTISQSNYYQVYFDPIESEGVITGRILFNKEGDYSLYSPLSDDWCGGVLENSISFYDGNHEIWPASCDNKGLNLDPELFLLRLVAMDNNYYKYFMTEEIGDYSNFLLSSPTTKGRAIGIEGGFGVFGAIGSDYKLIIAIP